MGNNCKNKTMKDDPEVEGQENNVKVSHKVDLTISLLLFYCMLLAREGDKHLKEYNQARPSGYF